MSTPLTVECHGKSYQHKAGPMQPLQTIIPAVLRQAGLDSKVDVDECQLILKGKVLDLTLPIRYVNIARGDKLLLKTGHEPLLGVQQSDKAVDSKINDRNLAREDTNKQRNDNPLNTSADSQEVLIRPGKGDATDRTQDVSSIAQQQSVAGSEMFVFRKEDEAQADKELNRTPDLQDEAYEVTETDIRLQLAQYSAKRSVNHILKTKRMREQEIAEMTASLGPVIIRFEFPGDLVVQASFLPTDYIAKLGEFVEGLLTDEASSSFYLFTAPPKVELKDAAMSLYEAGLTPRARVHVGFSNFCSSESNLKPEVLSQVGTPPSRVRTLEDNVERNQPARSVELENPARGVGQQTMTSMLESSRRGTTSSSLRTPAWMKLGRR